MAITPTPVVTTKQAITPAKSQVRRIVVPEGQTPESVLFPNEQVTAQEGGVMQSSTAQLFTPQTEDATSTETPVGTMPDWMKDFSEQDLTALESFQGDPAKLAKAYLDTKRGFTDKAMEAGGLKKMVADILEAQKNASVRTEKAEKVPANLDLKEFAKSFKDDDFITDPAKAVEKILEVASTIADAKAASRVHPLFQEIAKQQTEHLLREYPGMVTAENAKVIDAIASSMDGDSDMDRYKKGLKEFAKLTGYRSPKEAPEEVPDSGQTEQMRQGAQLAPVSAPTAPKKKIWTSRELQNMITQRPDDYARLQPEILRAYAEGRVRQT